MKQPVRDNLPITPRQAQQLIEAIRRVKEHGYGRVEIQINQGELHILYTILADKIEK